EPLPFAIDPLETLRPGSPNPRVEGNVWFRPKSPRGQPPQQLEVRPLKWSQAVFDEAKEGQLAMGDVPEEAGTAWTYGDLDAAFKSAALVLDETFVTPDTSNQVLEPRSALVYWQNGKVFVHTGTQSMIQSIPAVS